MFTTGLYGARHAHGSWKDTWPKQITPKAQGASYESSRTMRVQRYPYKCPLNSCRAQFRNNRELRGHYSKVHLAFSKDKSEYLGSLRFPELLLMHGSVGQIQFKNSRHEVNRFALAASNPLALY
jgi:hypothetical protein